MGYLDWITSPTSYQNTHPEVQHAAAYRQLLWGQETSYISGTAQGRPDFGRLTLLVFEAVLEVVCVSLPGYIVARRGFFDAEAQKFLANMNLMLFTPCLSMVPYRMEVCAC